jgi:hypothetical protein
MKTFISIAILLLSASVAHAWEYPQNPDRFPSVGFGVQGNFGTGHSSSGGFSTTSHFSGVSPQIDTLLPLSNSFTLGLNAGYGAGITRWSFGKSTSDSGFFGIHGRYYFNGAR